MNKNNSAGLKNTLNCNMLASKMKLSTVLVLQHNVMIMLSYLIHDKHLKELARARQKRGMFHG